MARGLANGFLLLLELLLGFVKLPHGCLFLEVDIVWLLFLVLDLIFWLILDSELVYVPKS